MKTGVKSRMLIFLSKPFLRGRVGSIDIKEVRPFFTKFAATEPQVVVVVVDDG